MKLIENYSDRAIALIGEETKQIKDKLKEAGGKFCPFLKNEGQTVAGWVFSKKRLNEVQVIIGSGVSVISRAPEKLPPAIEPVPEPMQPAINHEPVKIKVILKGEDKEIKHKSGLKTYKPTIKEIESTQFDPRLHYPVGGYGEIKVTIAPNADLTFKKPQPCKEKPFRAIFTGSLFEGVKEFKTAKELQKFVFELQNKQVGVDSKGRPLYEGIEGTIKVTFEQL